MERYLAICATKSIPPAQSMFNTKSLSRTKRIACRNIAFIWAISLCGAAPLLPLTRVNYLELDSQRLVDSAWCGLAFNEPDKRAELVVFLSTFVFFIIPLVLISYLYFKIARKLKKATRLDSYSDMQLTDHATSRKIIQSRKIVIRMLGKSIDSIATLADSLHCTAFRNRQSAWPVHWPGRHYCECALLFCSQASLQSSALGAIGLNRSATSTVRKRQQFGCTASESPEPFWASI